MEIEFVLPGEIEKRSFEIIGQELGDRIISDEIRPIIMRVIHTTADFDYADNLVFSENAVPNILNVIKSGAVFVTDTNMTLSGINKPALKKTGCEAMCFMSDADVTEAAKRNGTTRAVASVEKAAKLNRKIIYAVGNAPTALVKICECIKDGSFVPAAVIGVPVGFVNVVQSKEMLLDSGVPFITALGRKGGSNVSAAICNALLYLAGGRNV